MASDRRRDCPIARAGCIAESSATYNRWPGTDEATMATVRKRKWVSGGKTQEAWLACYIDQERKRRFKTFATKKAADAWLIQARHEVQRGVHTPASTSIT